MAQNFPRLLATLRLIPLHGAITASDIHRRLEALGHVVTRRTVERDLTLLATTYDLQCDDRNRPFGWKWKNPAHAPLTPQMGLPEALALTLVERELGSLMPGAASEALKPWFAAAKARIHAAGPTRARRWPAKIAIHSGDYPLKKAEIPSATQDAINEALFTERQITCEYRRAYQDNYRPARLHPLGQVRTGLVTYLVACFDGYSDPRTLPMHRIRRVQLLDDPVSTPPGFELQKYLDGGALLFGAGPTVRLRLLMDRDAAVHLRDTPLSDDQTVEPDAKHADKVLVSATVQDSPKLTWWIRGFGDAAQRLANG